MHILSVENVSKAYHNHLAVDNVSFQMPRGTIMGLLGPNGAGKTSLIRIITTITRADEGKVLFDGSALNLNHPEQIGYLPEERGLYKKMKVGEQLIYFAQLKGLNYHDAKDRLLQWMEKFEMDHWWNKKIEELSKGMQQKVQFVSTVVHNPKLIILDEPFTGLDPLNTNLIKSEIRKLNQAGTSIIFSTHRMEQVEEICEHIVLINKGRNILEGRVNDIKDRYKDHVFNIKYKGELPGHLMETVEVHSHEDNNLVVKLDKLKDANNFIKKLMDNNIVIRQFEEILPTLNEIFIKKVTES